MSASPSPDRARPVAPVQVFVVGTGRSGTATIAELLSMPAGCVVEHERDPKLLEELVAYMEGRLAAADAVELLRRTRSSDAIGGSRLAGEANQRLSFLLPALVDAFPDAKLVWLQRDGRDAVASMHHRGWYHPSEAAVRSPVVRGWATTRLRGDLVGDLSEAEWSRLDAFGRCCWYWAYTNRVIERDAARLGVEIFPVKLEQLGERLPDLAAYLGVAELGQLAVPRSNAASSGRPLSWRLWSRGQRATFERLCGASMDDLYPGWRSGMERGTRDELAAALRRAPATARGWLASRTWRARARLGLAPGVPAGRQTS